MTSIALKRILASFLVCMMLTPLGYVRAQTSVASAPQTKSSVVDSIKNTAAQIWLSLESFRTGLFETLARERDLAGAILDQARLDRENQTVLNRDNVLEGKSTSLYSGAGKRFDTVHLGTTAKYWFLYALAGIVSSAISFYGIILVIAVWLIRRIFGGRRGRI